VTRKEKLTLVATILGSTVVFLDSTIVNVALPSIQEDLDTGLAGQQWIVEAYLLTLVSLLLVGGSLGDLYGRKRVFMLGLVGFGATSILCAVSPSEEMLIGARALQGIAGAMLVPGSLAILASTFEGEKRGRAIGLWTAWSGISTLIGPAGGGLLVEFDWRLIFWLNIPLIAGTLLLTRNVVQESTDPDAVRGIDGTGILLSAAGLAGPVFALIEQPSHGFSDPIVWVPLIGGVAMFSAFIWWEGRARAPMMPLELFRSHNFSTVNLATFCVYAGLISAFFFITLFLQQVAGYSAFEAGLATMPTTILMFLLSGRFGALASRIGPRIPMGLGPLIAASGLVWLARADSDASYVTQVLPAVTLFGLGLSMTVAPLTTTVLDAVEERHVGIASGVNNAVARVAGVLAIAALGAVVSARFDAVYEGPASAGGRQPLAGGSPQIQAASTTAFHTGMEICAFLMAVGGTISLVGVRNPKRPSSREAARGPGSVATAGECGRYAS
jgi:EmrB/QacA subfamily drug resistance transporter